MRPYCGDQASVDREKKIFNYRLSRARNVSENAFGILVRKFRFLERKVCMSHKHIKTVLPAGCCLHHFLKDDTCHWTENYLSISISDMKSLQNIQKIGSSSISAMQITDGFKLLQFGCRFLRMATVKSLRRKNIYLNHMPTLYDTCFA
jgi:hypothetical protein